MAPRWRRWTSSIDLSCSGPRLEEPGAERSFESWRAGGRFMCHRSIRLTKYRTCSAASSWGWSVAVEMSLPMIETWTACHWIEFSIVDTDRLVSTAFLMWTEIPSGG